MPAEDQTQPRNWHPWIRRQLNKTSPSIIWLSKWFFENTTLAIIHRTWQPRNACIGSATMYGNFARRNQKKWFSLETVLHPFLPFLTRRLAEARVWRTRRMIWMKPLVVPNQWGLWMSSESPCKSICHTWSTSPFVTPRIMYLWSHEPLIDLQPSQLKVDKKRDQALSCQTNVWFSICIKSFQDKSNLWWPAAFFAELNVNIHKSLPFIENVLGFAVGPLATASPKSNQTTRRKDFQQLVWTNQCEQATSTAHTPRHTPGIWPWIALAQSMTGCLCIMLMGATTHSDTKLRQHSSTKRPMSWIANNNFVMNHWSYKSKGIVNGNFASL